MTRMSRHPSDAALTQAAGGDWLNLAACRSQRDRKIGTPPPAPPSQVRGQAGPQKR